MSLSLRRPTIIGIAAVLLALIGAVAVGTGGSRAFAEEPSAVVAIVNGKRLTADQLHLQFYLDSLPEDASAEMRERLVNELVDRELIRQFLLTRKVSADPAQVDHQVALLQKVVAQQGETLDDVLSRLHLTPESVREVLALPLAWERYVRSRFTEPQIQAIWNARRKELDGTRVQASQIVRTLSGTATEDEWKAAERLLEQIRNDIQSGTTTFAAAAKQHSQSPSARTGGDLGTFEYRGSVDPAIAKVAFQTPPGNVSEPFRSRFGVHLVQTHKVIPGQLVLEDARGEILKELGTTLRAEQLVELRKSAKIQFLPAATGEMK